ncbi:MAG TPA: FGGY family carbohydrate kinase, partial [bacterium]|nr:FGGY family carbohydrate kinase [bacterium]
MVANQTAILALDLGTTLVKGGLVSGGRVLARGHFPFPVRYDGLKREADPEEFRRGLAGLLAGLGRQARKRRLEVLAVGVASQAQTFTALDRRGRPLIPFIVWNDRRAGAAAELLRARFPDFSAGGHQPADSLSFAAKLLHLRRERPEVFSRARRFLLLNEWSLWQLTGFAFGDSTNFGMGGLYDLRAGGLLEERLGFIGVAPEQLARIRTAGAFGRPLRPDWAGAAGLPPGIPVFSCANDQAAAAAGAGVTESLGLVSLGTALVFYLRRPEPARALTPAQMTGIFPLGGYFLLSVEPSFGDLLDWGKRTFWPDRGWPEFWRRAPRRPAVRAVFADNQVGFSGLGLETGRADLLAALVELGRERFRVHLAELFPAGTAGREFLAGGGWAASKPLLDRLAVDTGIRWRPAPAECALLGV